MKTIKLKINKPTGGHAKGAVLTLKAHPDGQPIDRFWRARLKDSELDKCCQIVKNNKRKKSPTKPKLKKEPEE